MRKQRPPRVGTLCVYTPVFFDRLQKNTRYVKPGEVVRVIQPHGCPKNGTMGMCYIERHTGEFIGLCLIASLAKMPIKNAERYFPDSRTALQYHIRRGDGWWLKDASVCPSVGFHPERKFAVAFDYEAAREYLDAHSNSIAIAIGDEPVRRLPCTHIAPSRKIWNGKRCPACGTTRITWTAKAKKIWGESYCARILTNCFGGDKVRFEQHARICLSPRPFTGGDIVD